MNTGLGRRPSGRGRLLRRLLVGATTVAVAMACVANLSVGNVAPASTGPGGAIPTIAAGSAGRATSSPSSEPTPTFHGPTAPPATELLTVPILYYHRIAAPPSSYPSWSAARKAQWLTYDVLPTAFAAQLDWLQQHGYTTILPRDLAAHWDSGAPLPTLPVIITFDDGSRDWISTVLPMLKIRGMVAEFYLTLDAIKNGNVTWAGMRRLVDAGNGVGAHDVHHVQLAGLDGGHGSKPEATMWSEVYGARLTIGRNVGVFPDSMAYVGGGYNDTLMKLVQDAGYSSARSINRGIEQRATSRYRMHIVRIGAHDDVTNLLKGTLAAGLPTFTVRMSGVSDKAPD